MSRADEIFKTNCRDILDSGVWDTDLAVRPHWEDGTPAHTVKKFGLVNRYNLQEEFPILTLRRTYFKTCIDELLWIWQQKSNNIHDLRGHIWDSWAAPVLSLTGADGAVGTFTYASYFEKGHFLPIFFVTVACGILSGFHSTQTAIISRTMKSEKEGRNTFYNMMVLEGFIAMVWAAGAMGVYNLALQEPNASLATGTVGVVCKFLLGHVGGIIALIGVIVLPITSGDTALRALRLSLSETLHIDQSTNGKRIKLALPIFALVIAILVFAKVNNDGFMILWRYFAWANQTLSLFAFLCITAWMFENGKGKWAWIPMIPGCFYAFICVTYIANAHIGFNIPWTPAYIIGVVCAAAYVVGCCVYGKKRAAKLLAK